ncbi:hypothetical protein [Gephyromycinifex aptenodytis]|uniref:hypothetical protein n=1 Tax=Gephyromycinifex aptenodytis TaxID=2716227 RepID=UPI001446A17A|nr:hypothetical protein [Gephyromycinifex aptenodytis]
MHRIDNDTYVVTGAVSGRVYTIRRVNRAYYRGVWDVCPSSSKATYGTFATLPGARRWAQSN